MHKIDIRLTALTALGLAGLGALLLWPSRPVGAALPPASPPRLIEVSGRARLDVPPDRIDLTLALEEKRPSPRDAVRRLTTQRALLVRGLWKSGVRPEDLVLSQVSLRPVYHHERSREILDGYLASASLVATLRDSAQIGDVMESAAAVGVTRIHSMARTSKGPEYKKRVRDMAVRAAREKAEQIAKGLGIQVGPVQTVRELAQGGHLYGGLVNNENAIAVAPRTGEPPDKAVAPDAIRLHLDVSVSFAIR